MSRWDTRSAQTTRMIGSLLRSAGLAAGRKNRDEAADGARKLMEQLEDRVLLSGDEPNYNQVFQTNNPLPVPQITLDNFGVGTGVTGNGSSQVSPAGDTDVFRFTAPADDFVRIWADTLSTGSTLDSRVEVYTGTPGPGTPTLVASGSNNGTLTSGVFKDGWAGFKATAGTEYFVVVRSDLANGTGSIGDYTLRINAKSSAFPTLDPGTGVGAIGGNITRRGSDVVFKVIAGSAAAFDSVMTLTATSSAVDPRLDIYRDDGTLITVDDDSGNLTDAYAAIRSNHDAVFYVRVRSDKIAPLTPSTGQFTLNVDGIARSINLDPVTRLGQSGVLGLADQTSSELFRFQARGTGLSFITINVGFQGGLPDSAVRIYNDQGAQIGFNELQSAYSRLEIQLVGGQNYFVVVENFDGNAGGVFRVEVEAHHTYDANQPVDDHVSTPAANLPFLDRLHQFELATPVLWGAPQDDPVPVPGIGLPDPSADHVQVELGKVVGRIHNAGDTDLFQFVPPTDMLGDVPGIRDMRPPIMDPLTAWAPRFRPSTRLQILSNGETLENTRIRVFDSNLALVYDTNNRVLSAFPDPAGMIDPASFPPTLSPIVYGFSFASGDTPAQERGIKVWGGEVYYMEVSSEGGSGRYNVSLQVDAPVDSNATIPAPAGPLSKFGPKLPTSGNYASAYELQIDPNTGDSRNYNGVAGFGNPVEDPPGSNSYTAGSTNGTPVLLGRAYGANLPLNVPLNTGAGTGAGFPAPFHASPGTKGRAVVEMSDLGNITSPQATQLYQFRALYTGTAEVRIATTQITDEFWEGIATTEGNNPTAMPPVLNPAVLSHTSATKTYNSPLDAALRIFNNDQQQIQYNNDNDVTGGEFDAEAAGSFANRIFKRADPRTVFPVEAGKIYYIQVESGQRDNFSLTFPKVDWRHATGSYELMVNSMPNLNFGDDHINGPAPDLQATPIPMDLDNPSPTAVLGSVPGQILNTLANPVDTDLFTFFAPSRGAATVTVSTLQNDPTGFDRDVRVFHADGTLITQVTVTGTQDAVLSFSAVQGDRFYIQVAGADTQQQGSYTVSVSGVPSDDNHHQQPYFFGAIDIPKDSYDYDKTETVAGSIHNPGDTQIYQFQTIAYDVAKITIHSLDATLQPSVRIYEVGQDGAGNPILLPIAFNTAAAAGGNAVINFSVTAPNRTSGANGDTFNSYYVVVSGANPSLDFGDFQLTLDLNVGTDDHPDLGQWNLADQIPLDTSGLGSATGVIEQPGDTDLFTFTSSSQGPATIQITSPASSLLNVRVRIYDENNQPVLDQVSGNPEVIGPDQSVSVAEFKFTAQRNKQYFIVVDGVTPFGHTFKTANTGAYTVGISAPIPDDYPNIGEFDMAADIPISTFSGGGSISGALEMGTDTDLFKFTAIIDGTMTMRLDTLGQSRFTPVLQAFGNDVSHTEIGSAVVDGGPGDEDGQVNGSVQRTISMVAGQTYYILVSSDQAAAILSGAYVLQLQGTQPPPGPDDFANAGDYINAHQIDLSNLTGQGSQNGNIEQASDTDLFYIRPASGSILSPRKAYVQVVTPAGEVLDVGIRIIRLANGVPTVLATDSAGGPGTNAQTSFDVTSAGAQYFIEVDGLGGTGVYTVRVAAAPLTYNLYFPEGYANANIREYISMGNANSYDVNYTIRFRYESGDPETVVSGTILANHRGGITVSDGTANPGSGVLFNKPYAIVIESDGFLGANLSHYDFGNTLGEAFTGTTSTTWSFAQAEKFPGIANDFILYYNPNPTAVVVTLTAYQTDPSTGQVTTVAMSQVVQGFRRFGWNVNQTGQLPVGKFAFTLTSANAPGVPANTPHIGIVAELSHNDLANHFGYAVLGDPTGGATSGVIPGVVNTAGATPIVTFFNSSNTAATIGIIGRYIDVSQPDLIKNITLNPGESRTFDATSLGLVPNQVVGLRWDSSVAITAIGGSRRNGSSDITQGAAVAGTDWFYGDAFINRRAAGTLYYEDMYFYNPDTSDLPVTLTFYFNNSNIATTYSLSVPAKGFATVALHTLPAILQHAVFNYFSIGATAARPFVSLLSHYDLVLNGGWGTKGAPLGLTNQISTIS